MCEDKQAILDALCETLKLTRNLSDIESITYEKSIEIEFARVHFANGVEKMINISCNSGTAMIRDVMKKLGY